MTTFFFEKDYQKTGQSKKMINLEIDPNDYPTAPNRFGVLKKVKMCDRAFKLGLENRELKYLELQAQRNNASFSEAVRACLNKAMNADQRRIVGRTTPKISYRNNLKSVRCFPNQVEWIEANAEKHKWETMEVFRRAIIYCMEAEE